MDLSAENVAIPPYRALKTSEYWHLCANFLPLFALTKYVSINVISAQLDIDDGTGWTPYSYPDQSSGLYQCRELGDHPVVLRAPADALVRGGGGCCLIFRTTTCPQHNDLTVD